MVFWIVRNNFRFLDQCFMFYKVSSTIYWYIKKKLKIRINIKYWFIYKHKSLVFEWLAASLEPLAHRRNVASLRLFYRYYFGRCSSELAQLIPLPFSLGRSTHCSDRLHEFSVTIRRCYNDIYVKSLFPLTTRLWSSLPMLSFDQWS